MKYQQQSNTKFKLNSSKRSLQTTNNTVSKCLIDQNLIGAIGQNAGIINQSNLVSLTLTNCIDGTINFSGFSNFNIDINFFDTIGSDSVSFLLFRYKLKHEILFT